MVGIKSAANNPDDADAIGLGRLQHIQSECCTELAAVNHLGAAKTGKSIGPSGESDQTAETLQEEKTSLYHRKKTVVGWTRSSCKSNRLPDRTVQRRAAGAYWCWRGAQFGLGDLSRWAASAIYLCGLGRATGVKIASRLNRGSGTGTATRRIAPELLVTRRCELLTEK